MDEVIILPAPPPYPDYVPPYSPEDLGAIRSARENLYVAQAARRRHYLLTGRWAPQLEMPPAIPREGEPVPMPPPAMMVNIRRDHLDTARALALDNAGKK